MLQPRPLHGREKPSFSSMTLFFPLFLHLLYLLPGMGEPNKTRIEQAIKMRSDASQGTQRAQPALEPALCVTSQLYINSVQSLSNFQGFFFFFPALMPYFGLPLAAQQPSLHSLAQRSCAQEEYLKLLGWKLGRQSSPGASFSTTLVPGVGAVQRVGSHPPSWGTAGSDPSPGPYRGGKCY